MQKNFKVIIFCLAIIIQTNMQCQKNNEKMEDSNHYDNNKIEEILWKQLEKGYSYYYLESGVEVTDKFTKEDLEATIFETQKILTSQGFKLIDNNSFNKKIKNIFNRSIDTASTTTHLYSNFYDKCDANTVYYPNNTIDYQGLFIIKNKNFITDFYFLPQIINYQKEYPHLLRKEKELINQKVNKEYGEVKVTYWEDVYDSSISRKNIQTIVSRNKYLFNDDKSQFVWLTYNDKDFMGSLVKIFGYTEDKKLLKWVIEKTELPLFYTYAKSEDLHELGKLFWTKQCNGEIKIHQNTLNLIKELSSSQENLYIRYVAEYINYLEHNKNTGLNLAQKSKILAYLLYFGEQYKYDKQYDYNQMFMGHFFHYIDDGKYYEEFKRNNFYSLENFKKWYEIAMNEENLFKDDNELPDSPQPLDYEYQAKPVK